MLYCLDSRNVLVGKCEEPTVTAKDYARIRGWKYVTLKEAAACRATCYNDKAHVVPLVGDFSVRIDEKYLEVFASGKWRVVREWTRKALPTDSYVQKYVEKLVRLNCPLDPTTIVIWHWEETK